MENLEQKLETKEKFCKRVYRGWSRSNLDKKPYDATVDIVEETWNVVGASSDDFRARALCYWFYDNFEYAKKSPYGSASEAFKSRKGNCVNSAILYTTMAKIAGLDSSFVFVTGDQRGKFIDHACSAVKLDNRLVLVDPSNSSFDLKYREFRVVDDAGAIECFNNYFMRYNIKDFKGAKKFVDQVVRKKFPLYVDYDSHYDKCDPKYLDFLVQKMREREEKGFGKDVAKGMALNVFYSFLVRIARVAIVPSVLALGVGATAKFSEYAYLVDDSLEKIESVWEGIKFKKETMQERLDRVRPLMFNDMKETLKELYPSDDSLDLIFSEDNYLVIGEMYKKYLKSKISF